MILDYPGGPISSQSLLQEEEEGTGSESERSFEGATRLGLERQEGAGSHRNVGGLEELKKPRKQIVPQGHHCGVAVILSQEDCAVQDSEALNVLP